MLRKSFIVMAENPTLKKRSFDAAFKLRVLEYAEKTSNREAGRKYKVNEKSVRYWKKKKNDLSSIPTKKRIPGGDRKAKLPDMEEQLATWITDQRAQHLRVTSSGIQKKALQLHLGEEEFTTSRGWLEKFFRRYNFSLRRRTTVCQKLPQDYVPKIVTFIIRIRKMREMKQYPLASIGNMDETPLWMDMPGDTTVASVDERSIPIRTSGHEKSHVTVILTAFADGRKLQPFVVFKGIHPVPELARVPGVVVRLSRNGWMNEALTVEWLDAVWGRLSFRRRLLVWDAYRYVYVCVYTILHIKYYCYHNLCHRCHMTESMLTKQPQLTLLSFLVVLPVRYNLQTYPGISRSSLLTGSCIANGWQRVRSPSQLLATSGPQRISFACNG